MKRLLPLACPFPRAQRLILLVDSSKFHAPAGQAVCALTTIHGVITDDRIAKSDARMVKSAGVELTVVPYEWADLLGSASSRHQPSRRRGARR